MGRSKKLANGEITNEKILGKLPKVKSNIESLDFDEDTVDGISILSFNTYDDLKEYYPIEKIQPSVHADQPKKPEAKKRKIRDKTDKNKSRPVKRKPVIKQPALGASNLTQFDKSESEAEDDRKNLLIKTEESPPPSPLPEIPHAPVSGSVTGGAATIKQPPSPVIIPGSPPSITNITIKSEGCATSSGSSSAAHATTPIITPGHALPPTSLPTCGSDSPVYQPATQQHLPIPISNIPTPLPASLPSSLTTPPGGPAFYPGLSRQHPVASPHHSLPFPFRPPPEGGVQLNAAELEMKLNAAKFDPRYLMANGRFPTPADASRYRAMATLEYEKYLQSMHRSGQTRHLYPHPGAHSRIAAHHGGLPTPHPGAPHPGGGAHPGAPHPGGGAHPSAHSTPPRHPKQLTPSPAAHSLIPNRTEASTIGSIQGASATGGTAIKRQLNAMYKPPVPVPKIGGVSSSAFKRLNEKKWNSIHVYIARMIYRKQQEAQEALSSSSNVSHTEAATAAFLATTAKRDAVVASGGHHQPREFTPYPGIHSLPPTPSSPFSRTNPSYNPALHPSHHHLGIRGLSSIHGLGSRFPAPSIRPQYPGLGPANLYGHPGLESLRHGLPASDLARLDQERLQQHLASLRSTELFSRSMYESSLRQQAQQREHEMQQAISRDMLLHLEAERRKMLAASDNKQSIPPHQASVSLPSNLSELYSRGPLPNHLKYPGSGVGPNPHTNPSFPSIFNRPLDPRARFSHLIPPPKGPE